MLTVTLKESPSPLSAMERQQVEATDAAFVSTIVERALAVTESEEGFKPVQVVGVVVNRVRTARMVAERLRAAYRERNPVPEGESDYDRPDVVLLTGRNVAAAVLQQYVLG